ncbi:hypothetical protein HDU81_008087 [Chytriomyces hyalinus]|nr:hypothetical protein HDU81_008087 [Chytriomyces hyalinus]
MSPVGKGKTPMPIVISPTSATSKKHVYGHQMPRFGGSSSSAGSSAPALVPIETDPKIAKFVNLFEETVGVRHSDGVTPVHRKHVDVLRPKTTKPTALPAPTGLIPNHTYFPDPFGQPPIANGGAHGLGARHLTGAPKAAINWPSSSKPQTVPYPSTLLQSGRATDPPPIQYHYGAFGAATLPSAPKPISHMPGSSELAASNVPREAKASTSRVKKRGPSSSAAHPPAARLPVPSLAPTHSYFNQPASSSHAFSNYLKALQDHQSSSAAAVNSLHSLTSNPPFLSPFSIPSGSIFKAEDNPDDNCPVCGVKIVGVLSKMDEERHLRICFGDEEPEPLPAPVVDVEQHVSKKLRVRNGSANESVRATAKHKDVRTVAAAPAPPPLKLVGNAFVGIKDWFQTKEKKKEAKACPTHGE